jgi:hypothetical protein
MIEQHRYRPPRKSEPCATARRRQAFQDHPVETRLLRGSVLKSYATVLCVGLLSLCAKAK